MQIILVLLILSLSGCSVVGPGHKGVEVTMGKVDPVVRSEGPYFWVPFIRSIKSIDVRLQKHIIKTVASSKDLQVVHTDVAVNWRINPTEVARVYQGIGDEDQIVDTVISPATSEVLKAATAKLTAEEIIGKRIELKNEIDEQLNVRLSKAGIILDQLNIVDLDFTKEFSRAVEDKQIAEQRAKQAEYEAIRAQKDAVAAVNRAKGESESQKLMQHSITPEILEKMAIEKWNGVLPEIMAGGNYVPFINLDKKKR